jgi:hypothetical protein
MFIATKQEMVSEAQTRALNAPDANFAAGQVRQQNGMKPSKT